MGSNLGDPYDEIAKYYYLWFEDWRLAVEKEGARLHALLGPRGARSVLDCTCGTGPQCIGLAARGYSVTGCDSSPRMLREARRNSREAGLKVRWLLADIRSLQDSVTEAFDTVLTCGNSLAHLSSDADLEQAAFAMYSATLPGGCCLVEACDYEALLRDRPAVVYSHAAEVGGRRAILYDKRTYGDRLIKTDYNLLVETGKGWKAKQFVMELRPWRKDEYRQALLLAGFRDIVDLSTGDDILLLGARRP